MANKSRFFRTVSTPSDLIDGSALCELLKEHRLGVAVEMVEDVTVVPSFFEEI